MPPLKLSAFTSKLEQTVSFDDAFKLLTNNFISTKLAAYVFIPKIREEFFLIACECSKYTHHAEIHELSCIKNEELLSYFLAHNDEPNFNGPLIIDWQKSSHIHQIKSAWLYVMLGSTSSWNCYTLVLPCKFRGIALLSFAKDKISDSEEFLNTVIPYAKKFHEYSLHSPFFQEFVSNSILQKLTLTEKKLLKFILTGKPMKTLSKEVGITPKYGEKLTMSIRKKLGGLNRTEVIYLSGLFGLDNWL